MLNFRAAIYNLGAPHRIWWIILSMGSVSSCLLWASVKPGSSHQTGWFLGCKQQRLPLANLKEFVGGIASSLQKSDQHFGKGEEAGQFQHTSSLKDWPSASPSLLKPVLPTRSSVRTPVCLDESDRRGWHHVATWWLWEGRGLWGFPPRLEQWGRVVIPQKEIELRMDSG